MLERLEGLLRDVKQSAVSESYNETYDEVDSAASMGRMDGLDRAANMISDLISEVKDAAKNSG
jgi:hypothetical protein